MNSKSIRRIVIEKRIELKNDYIHSCVKFQSTIILLFLSTHLHFLQKSRERQTSITHADVNGFMNAVHGADTENGPTLILHTLGGDTSAVENSC